MPGFAVVNSSSRERDEVGVSGRSAARTSTSCALPRPEMRMDSVSSDAGMPASATSVVPASSSTVPSRSTSALSPYTCAPESEGVNAACAASHLINTRRRRVAACGASPHRGRLDWE